MSDTQDAGAAEQSYVAKLMAAPRKRLARIAAAAVEQKPPAPRPTFGVKGWQVPDRVPAPRPPRGAPSVMAPIIEVVSDFYRCSPQDMFSDDRCVKSSRPRHMAISLCRELTDKSLGDIASRFNRERATISIAIIRIRDLRKKDPKVAAEWDELLDRCRKALA